MSSFTETEIEKLRRIGETYLKARDLDPTQVDAPDFAWVQLMAAAIQPGSEHLLPLVPLAKLKSQQFRYGIHLSNHDPECLFNLPVAMNKAQAKINEFDAELRTWLRKSRAVWKAYHSQPAEKAEEKSADVGKVA